LGQLLGVLADLGRQSGGILLEVFVQHFGLAQVFLKNLPAIQIPERALQTESIKRVKNPHDILPVLFYKDNMGWSGWEEFRNLTPNDKTNLQEQE
jgi:hypothetical protein